MDPNLFRIDWDVLAEVMATIVVLSFFIERALALLFEHRFMVNRVSNRGLKEPIALVVSFAIVRALDFDALAIVFHQDETKVWGCLVTAAIVAGGSKASMALFHNAMNAKSAALREKEQKNVKAAATPGG